MGFELDHFKLYEVQPLPAAGHKPTLLGQFDTHAQTVEIYNLRQFANPVSKNGESIKDPNAHFTVYDFGTPVPDPPRWVKLENQFGVQELVIDLGLFLLVPAYKIENGLEPPKALDHYKCYRVIKGESAGMVVSLKDQFVSEDEVLVVEPIFFGVPVVKRYNNQVHEINKEKEHLTIYRIVPRRVDVTREFKDQFLSGKLEFRNSFALALPSLKSDWKLV